MSLSSKYQTLAAALRGPGEIRRDLALLQKQVEQLSRIVGWHSYRQLIDRLPPDHLSRWGFSVYSQNEEDGILAEIFRRIGPTSRWFVEIGTGDGLQCNTTHLLLQGWSGAWLEIDSAACERARRTFARYASAGRLNCIQAKVTKENVRDLLVRTGCPAAPDLLSIDIDGNDYWVWQAIDTVRPRVVVIEYNSGFGPDLDWIMDYDPDWAWDGSRKQGASLAAFARLGQAKGYRLVGCNAFGINAFFVDEAVARDAFPSKPARDHYMPPLYAFGDYQWPTFRGHRPSEREIIDRFHEPTLR